MTQQPLDAITYSEARQHLAETMIRVCDAHAPIIITRQKAEPVVMVSLADYSSLAETAYLLQSPKNAARLRAARDAMTRGNVTSHDLIPCPER